MDDGRSSGSKGSGPTSRWRRTLTRRQALKAGAGGGVGLAAVTLLGAACGNSEGDATAASPVATAATPGGTATSQIPPSPHKQGAQELPYTMDGDVKVFELTASPVMWEVIDPNAIDSWADTFVNSSEKARGGARELKGKTVVEAWAYNEMVPGPLIRVTEGDKIRIIFENRLPEESTIHWHGIAVPNAQDGVPVVTQAAVQPGESWTYEFTVTEMPGNYWYHTHANTAQQLARGLYGPFVIDPPEPTTDYDREFMLMLHEMGGFFTINGKAFPSTATWEVKEGEKILFRASNAGTLHHPMHLHGHRFKVVAIDGAPAAAPQLYSTFDIAPGQMIEAEVEANNPGAWVFHCHVVPHVTNLGVYPGGMLLVVKYV